MATIPQEIETKIIRHVPPLTEFERRLKALGAVLVKPRRLLSDRRFRLVYSVGDVTHNFPTSIFKKLSDALDAAAYLGLTVVKSDAHAITVATGPASLPVRAVRLRCDAGELTLNIKQRLTVSENKTQGRLVERGELEVGITNEVPIEHFIKNIGYRLASDRKKFRTTWKLGDAHIEWNECPLPTVPPWIEIEASSRKDVETIVERLGFSKRDMSRFSEAEYYRYHGLKSRQIRHLTAATL